MTLPTSHHSSAAVYAEWIGVVCWISVFVRVGFSSKPLPGPFRVPGKILRFFLIVLTLGFLSACSNADPLAVASGPVFAHNVGHWQPTLQDLTGPPMVVEK